jgi:hypothetical protein
MKAVNKIVKIAVLLSFFFAVSSAVAESGIVTDPEDDVLAIELGIDEEGDEEVQEQFETDEVPSADIIEVSYDREDDGTEITIKFEVNDRGKIEIIDLDELEDDMDFMDLLFPTYLLILKTDKSDYEIMYSYEDWTVNGEPIDESEINISDNEFSASFNLNSANETIQEFGAISFFMELSFSGASMIYMDAAPDSFMLMAEMEVDPSTASVGETIEFTGIGYNIANMMGVDFAEYEYEWDFDDGSTDTGETVTHSYRLPGTYTVRLTVSDLEGAETTATQTITVSEASTPSNGDENGSDDEDDEDSPILVFIAILGIIVAIGIIALIVVIRR